MASQGERMMQIGELAREAGISHRAIHHYERLGLLTARARERLGYRYYDASALDRLWLIERLKQLGLSLEEMASVLPLYDEDIAGRKGKQAVISVLERHINDATAKIDELESFKRQAQKNVDRLRALIDEGEPASKT